MDPADSVIGGDLSHRLRQALRVRHHKGVKHRDDVALGLERARDLLVDPVLLLVVVDAAVHGARRAHQDKVARRPDALQQVVVKLARLQACHVQEDSVVPQLQVHLQQAGQLRAIGTSIAHEHVQALVEALLGIADVAPLHLDALLDLDAVDLIGDPALEEQLLVIDAEQRVTVDALVEHLVGVDRVFLA